MNKMSKLTKNNILVLKLLKESGEVSNDTYEVMKDIFSKNPDLREKLSHVNTSKERSELLQAFIDHIGVPPEKLPEIENGLRDTVAKQQDSQSEFSYDTPTNDKMNSDTSFDKRETPDGEETKYHDTSVDGGKPVHGESIKPKMNKNKLLNTIIKKKMGEDKWKKIVERSLAKANGKGNLNEDIIDYGDMEERILPRIVDELHNRKHSLGNHPVFPESDERNFEEKLINQRFIDVANSVKRHFGVNKIDNLFIMQNMGVMIQDSIQNEQGHEKDLEELAIRMVVEEYNIPDGAIEFEVELTQNISLNGTKETPSTKTAETEFENHDEIELANKEVYKRRFINAMTQGAAKKSTHMFHLVDDELSRINPMLPNQYAKMMSAADYMYYIFDDTQSNGRITGGTVKVEFPKKDGEVPKIIAKAFVFPVLIHELVKGVMEILASHGLPKDDKIQKWALDKADFVGAESWDMRLGPGLWEKFTSLIPPEDFNLKHQIYMELVSLPVDEFNTTMREIMAGTNSGKQTIENLISDIKREMESESFNDAIEKRREEFKPNDDDVDNLDDIDLSDWL